MTEILRRPLTDASAWTGAQMAQQEDWIYHLQSQEIDELEAACASVPHEVDPWTQLSQDDFPLAAVASTLHQIWNELEYGRGFIVIRGFPVQRYTLPRLRTFFSGLASHLGDSITQNIRGQLMDEVVDRGSSFDTISVRGYATSAALTPHCDSGDIVALLCVHPAKEGGISSIASAASIYNVILREHPELLDVLYRGFHYNIRGGGPPGEWRDITRHRVPVYTYHGGRLSVRFNAKAIRTADQLPGVEPLTPIEHAAIDCVEALAGRDDLRLDMELQAGDIQLLCNHTILHTRTAFVDYDEEDRKRRLLRLWINIPDGRELPLEFDDHYNTGARQGPWIHDPPVKHANPL